MKITVTVTIDGKSFEADGSPKVATDNGFKSIPLKNVERAVQKIAGKALHKYVEKHWG